ncbi:MAG: dynamin family protein [Gammaproteobacteria bacterium]
MLAGADNKANNQDRFREKMHAYDRWKADIAHAVAEYQQWLEDHNMGTPEVELRLHDTLEGLKSDRLVVAFVAEFSRGKTELINSIFFSDYQRRLLPSEAGRTTMCPTELFYDHENDEAYIRLLSIETRMEDLSITELKNSPERWTSIPLDINSPDQMEEALREVVKVKRVTVDAAKQLGLYGDELQNQNHQDEEEAPTHVDVPMWRHALISFPHPLLQQGLVVLDTPGLNALGSEPELTLSMLPNAHAVLFILAADTGVTRSDMDMWQFHIKTYRKNGHKGLVAALNKIDTLWDEMKTAEDVEKTVQNQCMETAKLLGIDTDNVFPVSAQKALVGKIRKDDDLLQRSRILELEGYLADKILPAKQVIVRDSVVGVLDQLLSATQQMVAQRFASAQKQLEDLRSLSGRNSDVITNLMRKTRERQATYNKNMESFQASRRILGQHSKSMLDALSIQAVDDLVAETRKDMEGSWTTVGLKKGMKTFFDGARDAMQHVASQGEQAHSAVQAVYRKFNEDLGLPVGNSKPFSLQKFRVELERLYEEAEMFRNSPITTMTEQHFVVKKFFISLVSHVRHLFSKTNKEADAWFKGLLIPLVKQISENKQLLDQHLETLCKINESRDSLDTKIREMEKRCALLEREQETLRNIQQRLHAPISTDAVSSSDGDASLSRAAS